MMPGMDGVTFLQILRQAKKHQNMPVVLVTALDISDVERRTRQYSIAEILPKTQRLLDNLMKTVNRIVGHTVTPDAHTEMNPTDN
jgi:CheY-like chemotaxis protein